MNKEEFVTYAQAIRLKKLGFDWECRELYTPDEEMTSVGFPDDFNYLGDTYQDEWFSACISAPTLSQVQKWLREVHRICISVNYMFDDGRWFAVWLNFDSGEYDETWETFAAYESALSAGIDVVLKLLEEKI